MSDPQDSCRRVYSKVMENRSDPPTSGQRFIVHRGDKALMLHMVSSQYYFKFSRNILCFLLFFTESWVF